MLLIALATILGAGSASAARPINSELAHALKEERVAGITWSVVDGTQTSAGAEGYSNRPEARRMAPENRVHVGSVTKTFVAVGILKLVSDGRLSLDTPVEVLLPEIRFRSRWSQGDPVRVRHLLDHTAGLEDARIWQIFSSGTTPDQPLGVVFSKDPSVLTLRTRPGEVFSYSNMGYTLAAMVIEKVTGERYEAWLGREILAPLDMKDSTFAFVSQTGRHADPRLAWGHLADGTLAGALPTAVRPAAQFTTTADDMAKFARFLMSDGRVAGRQIVDPRLLRQMGHVSGTSAARAGLGTGTALGLTMRDREGRIGLCHQGDTVGYHALMCLYPSEQKAFFLALNSDGDGVDLQRFHRILIEHLAPQRVTMADNPPGTEVPADRDGYYMPLVSRFAIERYTDILDGGVALRREKDHLVLERSGKPPLDLHPVGGNLLRASDRVAASHVLFRQAGADMLSDGQRTFARMSDISHYLIWGNLIAGLAGLGYFLLSVPVLALRGRRRIFEPAFVAILGFAPAGLLMYLLPFSQWGDLSLASASLCLVTVVLPLALILQIRRAIRNRYRFWSLDLVAALCSLQWLAVLAFFGLIPLRTWA
jgi:CubicO group peptidase (beta-lactamase class C family)